MPYAPTDWVNGSTPLSEANMDKIETGIVNASATAESAQTLANNADASAAAAKIAADQAQATANNAKATADGAIPYSQKGVANGVPILDAAGDLALTASQKIKWAGDASLYRLNSNTLQSDQQIRGSTLVAAGAVYGASGGKICMYGHDSGSQWQARTGNSIATCDSAGNSNWVNFGIAFAWNPVVVVMNGDAGVAPNASFAIIGLDPSEFAVRVTNADSSPFVGNIRVQWIAVGPV